MSEVEECFGCPLVELWGMTEIAGLGTTHPIYSENRHGSIGIEADGWLHTVDLVRIDSDGYIYVVDRKKDMIVTAGYKIYPAELERVISGHPAVAMVAIGGRPDELKGELARAYIVKRDDAALDESEILRYRRQHLAAYKVPRSVKFVHDLPKTSTGKIMRWLLSTLDA